MSSYFPDLEIYVLKPEPQEIVRWLSLALKAEVTCLSATHWTVNVDDSLMDIFFNAQAHKHFASLWFKQNKTPWPDDTACARAAHQALQLEVRCALAGWEEDQDEQEGEHWLKILHNKEQHFIWRD